MPASTPYPCVNCPHLDKFHGNCEHDLRQAIVHELADGRPSCPMFEEIRENAMQKLEAQVTKNPEGRSKS